jgi:hypothetical protein
MIPNKIQIVSNRPHTGQDGLLPEVIGKVFSVTYYEPHTKEVSIYSKAYEGVISLNEKEYTVVR